MYLVARKIGDLYGIVDSNSGIIEDYTETQLADLKSRGIDILGVSRVGIHIISLTHLISLTRSKSRVFAMIRGKDTEKPLLDCVNKAVVTAPSGTSLSVLVKELFRSCPAGTQLGLAVGLFDFQRSLAQEDADLYDNNNLKWR